MKSPLRSFGGISQNQRWRRNPDLYSSSSRLTSSPQPSSAMKRAETLQLLERHPNGEVEGADRFAGITVEIVAILQSHRADGEIEP